MSPATSSASGPIVLPSRSTVGTSRGVATIADRTEELESRSVEAATTGFAGSDIRAASARKTTSALTSDFRLEATSSLIWKPAAIAPTVRLPPSRTGAATTWKSSRSTSQMPSAASPCRADATVGTSRMSRE